MSVTEGFQIPVEGFGGLVSNIDPAALPPGVSPDCADVAFKPGVPGTVQTRPGLQLVHTFDNGGGSLNYFATYTDLQSDINLPSVGKHNLYLTAIGQLYDEFPENVFTLVADLTNATGFRMKSDTAFGSEFIAFSDGKFGTGLPRRYTARLEGTTFDRLSQLGPGLAPIVVDGAAGHISAGVHKFSVVFITRNGYFTAPAEFGSYSAAGNLMANVSAIPIGPPNVIARLLIFTAQGGSNFFFSQSTQLNITTFLIPDNTTTTWTVDFTDLALLSSQSADLLFDRIELPEVAGLLQFADRIFAWGARNRIPNLINMSFDGGVLALGGYPLGWTIDGVSGAGGSTENSTIFGFNYVITVVGAGLRGMIEQPAWRDSLGVAILAPLTFYGLRVWLKDTAAMTGTFTVDLFSPGGGGVLASASVPLSQVSAVFTEFIVPFNLETPATIPADTIIRVYANVTGGTGALSVKNLEVYPSDEPFQSSVLFASNAADPEAFQGVTGFINVNENDGYRIVSCGVIRDRLYIGKNVSGLFVTSDDASNEPSGWTLDTISRRIGFESIHSMGAHIGTTGEDWLFLMAREGLYIFWSSEPPKISQEIQPTWDGINFNAMYTGWIAVDVKARRVLLGLPFGASQTPNKILQMDYKSIGDTAQDVAGGAPVKATYTGAMKAHSAARKWAPWLRATGYGGLVERSDGQAHMFISDNVFFPSVTIVADLLESALVDYDGPIPGGGYYVTAPFPSDEQKQQLLQMKGNRALQRYMTLSIEGVGDLQIQAMGPGFVNSYTVPIPGAPPLLLSIPASQDMEAYFNFGAERIFNKISVRP